MNISSVSKEYAKALFLLGKLTGKLEEIEAELNSFNELVEGQRPLKNFLLMPQLSAESKVEVLKKALSGRVSPELMKFLLVLTEKRREAQLAGICASYREEMNRFYKRLEVRIESAVELTGEEKEGLRAGLSKHLNLNVLMHASIDTRLIGGLVCHIGDTVYDGSIRRRIQRLANLMLKAKI